MAYQSFSSLNQHFESVSTDPSLFEADGFNFLKLIQHGLSYSDSEFKNKLVKNHFQKSITAHLFRHRLVRLVKGGKKGFEVQFKDLLIYEFGRERYNHQGEAVSMYFQRWKELFGRDKITILQKNNLQLLSDFDYSVAVLKSKFNNGHISTKGILMLKALHKVVKKIIHSGKFSAKEIDFITSSFHVFSRILNCMIFFLLFIPLKF